MTVEQIRVSMVWIKITGFIIAGLLGIIFFVLKEIYIQNKKFQDESAYDRIMIKMTILRHWPEEQENLFPKNKSRGGTQNHIPSVNDYDIIFVPDENSIATER